MNKQSKSLGKRSTNTASLSNAISSIKESISPVIVTSSTRNHPKARKTGLEQWVQRTVRIHYSCPTTANFVPLSNANIFSNAGISGQIRILGLKVWNYTNSSRTTNYIQCNTQELVTETKVETSVADIGSGLSLPGVSVTIPRTIASNLLNTTDTAAKLYVTPSGNPSDAQLVVVDVHFEYKTAATN